MKLKQIDNDKLNKVDWGNWFDYLKINAHSQAHLQFAKAATQPKIAKELVCFPALFCRPEKQNQVSAKLKVK